MEVATIERTFQFKKSNKEVQELDDINPQLSNDDVLNHYTMIYPELTTAKVEDKGIVNGKNLIVFNSIAGTKG